MASALDARVWRRTAQPDAIEAALTELWRDVGQDASIVRATMSNLVVVAEHSMSEAVDLWAPVAGVPIEEIARRHPARIILLHHVRQGTGNCPPVQAAVAVITFDSSVARYGVETLAVHSRCAETALPSIVRRLTLGDLPTTVWWTDDLSRTPPLRALVTMGRQFVYDSRQWRDVSAGFAGIGAIARTDNPPDLADLNWRRTSALRAALAAVAREHPHPPASSLRARISHRPGDAALGRLILGWLAARMQWPANDPRLAIEEWRHGDDVLRLVLEDDRGTSIACDQNGHRVVVRDSSCPAPVDFPIARTSAAEALAAELSEIGEDRCLIDAIQANQAVQ